MDENQSVLDELHRLQSNISSLFESLANERNKLKNEKDKSLSCVETLVNEVANLKKENEFLRKLNSEKRRSCETCVGITEKFRVQNRKLEKVEKSLSTLRKFVNEMSNKVPASQFPKLVIRLLDELGSDDSQGIMPVHDDVNFFRSAIKANTESVVEEQACDTVLKLAKPNELNLNEFGRTSDEKINDKKPNEQTNSEDLVVLKIKTEKVEPESASVCNESNKLIGLVDEFRTPKKVDKSDADFIDSPFCAVAVRKGETSPILCNRLQGTSSPHQFKRKAGELGSGSLGKGVEKKLFLRSPNRKNFRSPAKGSKSKFPPYLKFSNSVEAEISPPGVKKLKQTQLNFEFYKSKNDEESNSSAENICGKDLNREVNDDENKFGEDDLIFGSPKQPGNSYDAFMKNFRIREQEDDKKHSKPAAKLAVDQDETFVNSLYLEDHTKKGSEECKPATKSPPKVHSRSPEYNSVPYPYKGSPVRKKSERMKLPGQMCMECHKYYRAFLGEIDHGKMQEILNQCSKHRDKHYNVVQTPPGYWKPYLTETMDTTIQDDDTCLD